jgi:hypothetical protein
MLGVHFAITSDQERLLLAADDEGDSHTAGELLEDIEESWRDRELKVDTDKAWDAIHRCLTDGTLDPDGGEHPLSLTVIGGRHLPTSSTPGPALPTFEPSTNGRPPLDAQCSSPPPES